MTRPVHRTTSATLQACWPLPARSPFPKGVVIGLDQHQQVFRYDPWDLYDARIITNPNIVVVGHIGRGKSSLVKTLLYRSLPRGRRAAILDPKGEYAPLAHAAGCQPITLRPGGHLQINPLDPGPCDDPADAHRQSLGLLTTLLAASLRRDLTPLEHTTCDHALHHVGSASAPTLPGVAAVLAASGPELADAVGVAAADLTGAVRDVAIEARRLCEGELGGLLAGDTTPNLPDQPILTVQLADIDDTHLPVVLVAVTNWLRTHLERTPGESYLVLDEAWRLLQDTTTARWLRRHLKLARTHRTAVILVTQRLTDLTTAHYGSELHNLTTGLLADIETHILLGLPASETGAAAALLGLDPGEAAALTALPTNVALWRIGQLRNRVRHALAALERALVETDHA